MAEDDCTVARLSMIVLWYGWGWLYCGMVEDDCIVAWLRMTTVAWLRMTVLWYGWGWLYCGMAEDDCTVAWLRMIVLWHGWGWLCGSIVEDDCIVAWFRMTVRLRGLGWLYCGMVEDNCTVAWLRMTVLWHSYRWLLDEAHYEGFAFRPQKPEGAEAPKKKVLKLPPIRLRRSLPPSNPNLLCLRTPTIELTHVQIKNMLESQLGNIVSLQVRNLDVFCFSSFFPVVVVALFVAGFFHP